MDKITLPRTGQAPLRFSGELLRKADGERLAGRERNRWHEIEIYRLPDGGCAVAIRYRTKWQGELGHDLAEVVENPGQVHRVLAEYDPLEHVGGFPAGPAYAERQARLEAEVRAGYEALVSEVLDDDLFAEDVSAAVFGQDVRARRHDLCRQLELASLHLSQAEASAICDAINGTMLDESTWQLLWAEIFDADRLNGLGEKWAIDAKELSARIQAASPGAQLALAEAVEEFWRAHHRQSIEEGLAAVGLVSMERGAGKTEA